MMCELERLRAENQLLKAELVDLVSYKELYEACAAHMTELQEKLDLVELAEAKARMSEEKYTAVALSDTYNEFKMQLKINKLSKALEFYSNKKDFINLADVHITAMAQTELGIDKGERARKALEGLDEKS